MKLQNLLHNKICVKVHMVRGQMKINNLEIHYMFFFFKTKYVLHVFTLKVFFN